MSFDYTPQDSVPLPPKEATVHTTVCDYCIVGCGYKVYTWPVGGEGGPEPGENALEAGFPGSTFSPWISPNQHNIVKVGGVDHHVVIVADSESQVVNRLGNHSIRGGTLALKCYHPAAPTQDRLLYPQIRINGELTRVDWDTALAVMAAVSRHVLANYGAAAWAMKTYSYEFFENTFAITKLAFGAIKTPAFSQHDKPAMGADTGGLDDSGLINFNASYDDWQLADVLFISGTDPFETKTVVFTEYMMKGPKLIMALPRRTAGVAFAETNGGLFLQVTPGTDTLLHLAISRIILENDWQDQEFVDNWLASRWDIEAGMGRGTRNTPWQWRTTWGQFGTDFAGYREWLLN
jgi:arsenite oxidase large subunit